jgi:hypothetical protein
LEIAKRWDSMSLKARPAVPCLLNAMATGAMLFLPAGTFKFWQGWRFLGLLSDSDGGAFNFYECEPQLVERRLQSEEKVAEQKLIMEFAKLIFFGVFFAAEI